MAKFAIILFIVLMIVTDIGASTCKNTIVAKEPKITRETPNFGEIHVLSLPQMMPMSNGSCSWEFSSPNLFLLNLQIVNFTTPFAGKDCKGFYAVIKRTFKENNKVEVSQRYCGQVRLPGIRINGTVEIELHYNIQHSNNTNMAMAVLLEASTEDCGGVFNDSTYGIPLMYNASKYTSNAIVHCVWYFDFSQELELNLLVSKFGFAHDFNSKCSGGEFLEIRAWNDNNGESKFTRRECKASNYRLPTNFTTSESKHFVVAIHSDTNSRKNEQVSALCFPTTKGYSSAFLAVDDIEQKVFQSALLPQKSTRKVFGLLFVKSKRNKDQLFSYLYNISDICKNGVLQIWTDSSNEFRSNSTLCKTHEFLSTAIVNTQSSSLIYFQASASELEDLHFKIFASNKGCGGSYQFKPGQTMLVKSPSNGQDGKYPPDSDCRWLFLANNRTEFDISVKEMYLEDCSGCWCDYLKIHQGSQRENTALYTLCEKPNQDYLVKGDMMFHFHSDSGTEARGFSINITAWKGCGEDFNLLPGDKVELLSPRYGVGAYPPNYFCQWNIITQDTTVLNISVVDLDLDPIGSSYWCFDYVDFFRGVYQNITLLHKICLKPSNSIAINGSSTIRFHSDYGGAGRGFRIIITAVSDKISTTKLPTTKTKTKSSSPVTTTASSTTKKTNTMTDTTGASTTKARVQTSSISLETSSKCCDKTTQGVTTKEKEPTKETYTTSTGKGKEGSISKTGKTVSSQGNVYVIGIVIPVVVIIFAAIAAIFYLKRRRAMSSASNEKNEDIGPNGNGKWRKRQSTVPLVDMENLRKLSCPDTSFPSIIENSCYGGAPMKQSNLEADNPYYSSNNDNIMTNPYYDSGAAMPAEYASIDAEENHLYSDVQAKKGEADYAYAFNPGCQTDSTGPQIAEDNPYAYIGNDHAI